MASEVRNSSTPLSSGALPGNYKPLYGDRDRLEGIVKELSHLARLGRNERPSQDYATRRIAEYIYPDPNEAAWIFAAGTRFGQACDRVRYGDSTASVCERVEKLCMELLYSEKQLYTSSRFAFLNGNKRVLRKYDEIQELMNRIAATALPNLRQTVENDEVKFVASTEVKKRAEIANVNRAIEKVVERAAGLAVEIEKLLSTQKGGVRGLDEVIEIVLNPVKEFTPEEVGALPGGLLFAAAAVDKLAATFGKESVNCALELYKLDKKMVFDYNDLHALIVGITSNLTYSDICDILSRKEGALYEKLAAKLGDRLPDLSKEGASIEEGLLFEILKVARDIDLGDKMVGSEKPYVAQYRGDISSIESCQLVEEYNFKESQYAEESFVQKLKAKYGYTEYLTRDHCYSRFDSKEYKFRPGVVIPLYDKRGEKVCRELHPIFADDAIFTMGVCPIKGVSLEEKEIEVVFRGTYDVESVIRDLSLKEKKWINIWEGPGGKTFQSHEVAIAGAVESFIAGKGFERGKVTVSGHSLGATDSERLAELMARLAAKNCEREPYAKVAEWEFVCLNLPGFETNLSGSFIKNVASLEPKGVQFAVNALTTFGDIVHEFGTDYLGHLPPGVEKPKNLAVNVVRFNFTDGRAETDSLRIIGENGSVDAAADTGYKKYRAHSSSWFKESVGKDVHVLFFCSDDDAFKELIDERDRGNEIPKERMNEVLTTSYKHVRAAPVRAL